MTRLQITAGLATLLTLAACERREQAAAPAAPKAAALAGPLIYEKKTDGIEVKLTLPEAVGRTPALYARLYSEGKNALDGFVEGSTEDVEQLKAAGLMQTGYSREIEYQATADTPRLLGLVRNDYEYTGGAHPNSSMQALTWDKATGKSLAVTELMRPGADMAAVDKALCDGILAEKKVRTGEAAIDGEVKACPKLADVSVALERSTVAGKAGGLTALFPPYTLGAYAEGSYEITLPLTVIQPVLSPTYAGEFGGQPAPIAKE